MAKYTPSSQAIEKLAKPRLWACRSILGYNGPAYLRGKELIRIPSFFDQHYGTPIRALDTLKGFAPEENTVFFFNGVEDLTLEKERSEFGSLARTLHSVFTGSFDGDSIDVFLRTKDEVYKDRFVQETEHPLFIVGQYDSVRESFQILKYGRAVEPQKRG